MITYGKFPSELIPDMKNSSVEGIRVIFKKSQKDDALEYCKKIKEKQIEKLVDKFPILY